MSSKGFLSRDFLVQFIGLVVSVIVIFVFYRSYVWPTAETVEVAARLQASQNPDEPVVANRSFAVIMKNNEQLVCMMLMMWALIMIAYKYLNLRAEDAVSRVNFVSISPGERIIPEEALGFHKDVESMQRRYPKLKGKILPEVILAALQRFDATHSIQDASHAVSERADMAYEQLESDLSLIRYIAWAIPSVGFIGTVRGISEALGQADRAIRGDIGGVTSSLGLAFNSTFIALLLSIGLMLMVHLLQSKQETLLIDLQDFASKSVVGAMKTPAADTSSVGYNG